MPSLTVEGPDIDDALEALSVALGRLDPRPDADFAEVTFYQSHVIENDAIDFSDIFVEGASDCALGRRLVHIPVLTERLSLRR